jgi:MSHA biogenesis protein MshP
MISAILLIVLLAGLGAVAVSVNSAQNDAGGLDVQGLRANQAAQAGIEWGSYQVMLPPYNPAVAPPACPAATNLVLPGSLAGFVASVTCVQSGTYTDGAGQTNHATYRLTATACNLPAAGTCPNPAAAPGTGYVERQITSLVQR